MSKTISEVVELPVSDRQLLENKILLGTDVEEASTELEYCEDDELTTFSGICIACSDLAEYKYGGLCESCYENNYL